MVHEKIAIRLNAGMPEAADAYLYTYVLDNSPEIDPQRRRPAVMICPGGGYRMTSDREAEAVAIQFNAMGYQCFVLRYAVSPARFPAALLQLMTAMSMVRQRAGEWHVNPDKVAVLGFSAGGHLAASLGCFSRADFCSQYGVDHKLVRPDGMVLCYPVITAGEYAHRGSFEHLLGEGHPCSLNDVSLEEQVHANTPPAFLWHTFDDGAVPVENSLLFAMALRKHGIPFELHIYPHGVHGLSLATPETAGNHSADHVQYNCSNWVELAGIWLQSLGDAHSIPG